MSSVLAFICIWSLLFSIFYMTNSIKAIISFEMKKFWSSVSMFIPFLIIWIDTFLRIFSIDHTGLW